MSAIAEKVYPYLEPGERLRASLSAWSRGDLAELDRLVDTCPVKHYTMPDSAFSNALRELPGFAAQHHLLQTRIVLAYMAYERAVSHAESKDGEAAKSSGLRETMAGLASIYAARARAWSQFCGRHDIPEDDVASLLPMAGDPVIEAATQLMTVTEDAQPDRELEDTYLQSLTDAWSQLQ